MDVAFYREQEQRCRKLAETTEDPEVKAALLALADENVEMAKRYAALSAQRRALLGLAESNTLLP